MYSLKQFVGIGVRVILIFLNLNIGIQLSKNPTPALKIGFIASLIAITILLFQEYYKHDLKK